jgi:hypothetical protein
LREENKTSQIPHNYLISPDQKSHIRPYIEHLISDNHNCRVAAIKVT